MTDVSCYCKECERRERRIRELRTRLKALEDDKRVLVGALEFYAEGQHWIYPTGFQSTSGYSRVESADNRWIEKGERARRALERVK
jgi:hypothetical protein